MCPLPPQILDHRFFVSAENEEGRSELLGCLMGGAYSPSHVAISKELALANPELTLPIFCGMFVQQILLQIYTYKKSYEFPH